MPQIFIAENQNVISSVSHSVRSVFEGQLCWVQTLQAYNRKRRLVSIAACYRPTDPTWVKELRQDENSWDRMSSKNFSCVRCFKSQHLLTCLGFHHLHQMKGNVALDRLSVRSLSSKSEISNFVKFLLAHWYLFIKYSHFVNFMLSKLLL